MKNKIRSGVEFHADDFGLFIKQSKRIIDCYKNGALSGISIMTNGPNFQECMSNFAHDLRELNLAVHLNFMEGHCMSEPSKIPLLADRNGIFRSSFGKLLLSSYLPGRCAKKKQIKREISAQIKALLPYIQKDRLRIDSHAHYHMIPIVFDSLIEVIMEENLSVSYIRVPYEHISVYLKNWHKLSGVRFINIIKTLVLNVLSLRNIHKHREFLNQIEKKCFFGVFLSGNYSFSNVSAFLEDAKQKAGCLGIGMEILAHPGGVWEEEDVECLTHKDDITFLTDDHRNMEAEMFLKI